MQAVKNFSARGRAKEALIGTPTSGAQADDWDAESWQSYVAAYREMFPDGYSTPSLFATNYYNATTAAMMALEEIGGEFDDDQANFHEALSNVVMQAPNGEIRLDDRRQAIGSSFITEVVEDEDGELHSTFKAKVDGITQTLGMSEEEFRAIGLPSRETPEC